MKTMKSIKCMEHQYVAYILNSDSKTICCLNKIYFECMLETPQLFKIIMSFRQIMLIHYIHMYQDTQGLRNNRGKFHES